MKLSDTNFRVTRPGLILLLAILTVLGACSRKSPDVSAQPAVSSEQPVAVVREVSADSIARHRQRFQQGIDALEIRDYAQARRIFDEIVSENSELSGPHANLALIDFREQKYDQSFERVNRSIGINPRSAQSYHLRAQLHVQRGEIKLARQNYEKAIELDSSHLNAHYNLALLYDVYLQEIALAIEYYSRYLALLDEADPVLQDWVDYLRSTLKNG